MEYVSREHGVSWRDKVGRWLLSFHPFYALKVFESGVSGTAWPDGLCYHEEDKQGLISWHEMFLSAGRKDNDHYIEKCKSYCKSSQAGIPEAFGEDTQPQALGQAAKRERFGLGKLERSWVYHCQELPMGREFCLCYRRQQNISLHASGQLFNGCLQGEIPSSPQLVNSYALEPRSDMPCNFLT